MVAGRLVGIYTTPIRGTRMRAREAVRMIEGHGLEGDRYATGTGTYSARGGAGRAVTLIEREVIAAVAADAGVALAEWETRRNLVTEGVALLDLVGRTFRIDDVVLLGVRPCPPCSYLEQLTRPGVWSALRDRGGLRADVVRGGTVPIGATIIIPHREAEPVDAVVPDHAVASGAPAPTGGG
ncbi:MOSC domain-containing protein [Frankia sp. CcI156]|jgi:MOSC domain-containing protein YiiM|uniref:MOSC n=1 Tax=Frankia casuarinae (strain DSM 45818 / CECT 9043 / HFP020203 / CcI3) TaxID=106370 RepID=Q2JEA1_FRACC|nr:MULTISPECIES: hypothetical protein [Frankia]ABD10391.1 MOSC [Frankia casuarinae]ETA01393.1 hypothetical protein CcI6DRAFT_03135 [Frankia sp. CcI6]EYT90138.1 hypothetical protein ThrDRAFT_04237 [Frankia casuarinae]KDA41407.1 hypothetical protein BMG523Draft_03781 [Frankia sp. BMG5.23]KFB05549.1 MOSC domain [Frankia sp. Allo2]